MRRNLLLKIVPLLMLITSMAWAQTRTVSGKVTSAEDGAAIPGVNVVQKGTTNGTTTDADGKYSLSVPEGGGILTFSFIGLTTQELEIGQNSIIDVQLTANAAQLSEVVVVGYGTQDRRTLTSAISTVTAEQIALKPIQSFDQALVGNAPGVQVTQTSGLLGQAPRIRIRGTNSITSGANPLYVVDGVPMFDGNNSGVAQTNALADINPMDIQSLEVLKDGSATAIYGSRAANGVILITTKRGKSGKPKIGYDFQVGMNTIAKKYEVLNAADFIRISNEKFATAGVFAPQALPGAHNVDTDWQKIIFRTGLVQTHNLNISGGSEDVSYFFSAGYTKQEGAIVNNSLDRYNMRANIDYKGVKWLNAGMSLALSRQINNNLNTGSNALSGNVTNALVSFPNVSPWDAANPSGYNLSTGNVALGRGNNLQDIASNYTNIKYVLDHNKQQADNFRILSNGYLQANIIEGLNVRTQLGIDIQDTQDFLSWDPIHGDGGGATKGILLRQEGRNFRWNWQNTINYKKVIADAHHIGVTIGDEFQKTTALSFYGQGQTYQDPSFLKTELISGSYATQFSGGGYAENGFKSLFGRLTYDFKSKYLVSFSYRNDAISSLSAATRKGPFKGGSIGWIVTEESFMANLPVISSLKVRASYAEVGNTNIGNYPYIGTYGPQLYGSQIGQSFANVGNSSLRWEVSKKLDAGFDIGVLDNRITASFDIYKNDISDLILAAPTPPTAGLPGNLINKNIGKMENTGVEISVTSDNLKSGALSWKTTVSFATNKNKITGLVNNQDIIYTYNINRVGQSIGSLYGFDYRGVNPSNGNPLYSTGSGAIIQGNPDNNSYYIYDAANKTDLSNPITALSSADLKVLGVTTPKFYGGVTNNLRWKGFDFEFQVTFSGGNYIMNVTRQVNMAQEFRNNIKEILNRWTPENPNTNTPRLSYANSNFINTAGNASSRFVEKGDFARIQNISLGYSVPKNILNSFGKGAITSVRVYAQVRNAYVFTKYKGTDPELNSSNTTNSQFGVDNNGNPLLRTFNFGLSVGF